MSAKWELMGVMSDLTLKATGTQHVPRSGNLMLCVRVGRHVKDHCAIDLSILFVLRARSAAIVPPPDSPF